MSERTLLVWRCPVCHAIYGLGSVAPIPRCMMDHPLTECEQHLVVETDWTWSKV